MFFSVALLFYLDSFIYPQNQGPDFNNSYLVEVDVRVKDSFKPHLMKYLLRSKIKLDLVDDEYQVWQVWGPSASKLWGNYVKDTTLPRGLVVPRDRFCDIGCRDPRNPHLGVRFILPKYEKRKK